MSADELHDLQLQKFRERLCHAAEWIPFYQRQFRQLGFDPRDVQSLDDVSQLPALSREDLVEYHADLVDRRMVKAVTAADQRGLAKPIPFAPFRRNRLVKHTSSGSTGEPVAYYEDGSTSAASWAFEKLFKNWYGIHRAPREVRMMRLATEYMPSGKTQSLRKLLWRHVVLPGLSLADHDYERSFDVLQKFQPAVLWGFTSALRGLAEYMLANGKRLSYRPKLVVTWAEPVHAEEEDSLQRAFDCPVTNLYSSHEVGHIACRCPAGSFHVDQKHLLVQVDRESIKLDDADSGELVITTLFDSPMPFIRYRMGDIGSVSESTCSCGRKLQVLNSLVGRTYELFTTRDGRMISPNFWLHLFRRENVAGFIKRFQITYKKDGNILIKIVPKPGHSMETEPELRQLVAASLENQAILDWTYVAEITPEPSGKIPIVKHEK